MQETPDIQRLEEILRSHKFSSTGFLGTEKLSLSEIINRDLESLRQAEKDQAQVAERMRQITDAAKAGLETTVRISPNLTARTLEARGALPCPWPHPGRYDKAVTTATRLDTGQSISWSDLNIHMIKAHGFFEGRGSAFRLEPQELMEIIFA